MLRAKVASLPGRDGARRITVSSAARRWLVVLVLLVALLLRVGYAVHGASYRPFADAASFDQTAVSLALRGEYPPSFIAPSGGPTAFRPPAYPYVLGALYRVSGTARSTRRVELARIMSALFSTGIVALVGLIAWMLWGWGRAAAAALILAAVYPPLVTIGDSMLAEPLFTALILAAVASVLAARRSVRPLRWAGLAGVLIGLASLARTNGIIVLVPLALGVWPRPRLRRRSLLALSVIVLSTLIVLAPWMIRNRLAFHRFVPITTQAGYTLAGTYNEVSLHNPRNPAGWLVPTMPPYDRLLARGENEATIEQHFRSAVLRFIAHHPAYVLEVGFFNLGRLLELQGPSFEHVSAPESGLEPGTSDLDVYAFYLLAAAALLALLLRSYRAAPAFLWGVPAAMAVSLIFVSADMRYRFPIDPFLIVLVAAAFQAPAVRQRVV